VRLERCLSAHGYRVQAFASAEQYLAEVDASDIACAVIDVELGAGLSGLDLGMAISSAHATPIVFMTGSRDTEYSRRARDIGCIEFLLKPFDVSRLIAAITRADEGP
jgi:FixJ family two-component response regulator